MSGSNVARPGAPLDADVMELSPFDTGGDLGVITAVSLISIDSDVPIRVGSVACFNVFQVGIPVCFRLGEQICWSGLTWRSRCRCFFVDASHVLTTYALHDISMTSAVIFYPGVSLYVFYMCGSGSVCSV